MKNEWAAKITFKNEKRGIEAVIDKIYAVKIKPDATIETIQNYLSAGMGIWPEDSLNRLIKSFGLIWDQAESGIGWATFKSRELMNY